MPTTDNKKQVLFVADNLKWAWGHVAAGIKKYAPDGYDVQIVDHMGFGAFTTPHAPIPLHWADAVVQSSWFEATFPTKRNGLIFRRNIGLVGSHGIEYPFPIPKDAPLQAKIATPQRNKQKAQQRLVQFDCVICVNPRLQQLAEGMGANAVYCQSGVDHNLFCPGNSSPHDKLRIGWCGQAGGLTKGYNEILVPLQGRLGDSVEWWVNTNGPHDPTPHEILPLWFRDIDVFLSTSLSEGSQNPPLEAMACGKPVIMTKCGTAENVVSEAVNGFLVDCYGNADEAQKTIGQIMNRIELMRDSRMREQMGAAARDRVEKFLSWEKLAPVWLEAILAN